MEIAVGIIGVVIAILVWLFPPEPLRKRLGWKEPHGATRKENTPARKRELTQAFRSEVEKLEIVDDGRYSSLRAPAMVNKLPMPRIVEGSQRAALLNWIDSLDDELLLVTLAIRGYWQGKDWREGYPRTHLLRIAQPFGVGRSLPSLVNDLTATGVLTPRDNGDHFDYGPNLQRALDYIDLLDWDELKRLQSQP